MRHGPAAWSPRRSATLYFRVLVDLRDGGDSDTAFDNFGFAAFSTFAAFDTAPTSASEVVNFRFLTIASSDDPTPAALYT